MNVFSYSFMDNVSQSTIFIKSVPFYLEMLRSK